MDEFVKHVGMNMINIGHKKESVIERQSVKLAEARGWFNVKLEKCNKNGMPDRMFMYNGGIIVFVEFKTDVGRLSQIQTERIKQLRDIGHKVYVVRSVAEMGGVLDAEEPL